MHSQISKSYSITIICLTKFTIISKTNGRKKLRNFISHLMDELRNYKKKRNKFFNLISNHLIKTKARFNRIGIKLE